MRTDVDDLRIDGDEMKNVVVSIASERKERYDGESAGLAR